MPKLKTSKNGYNAIKIQISAKLSEIATYLQVRGTVTLVGAAICAFIPGAQVGALVLSILGALEQLVAYLIDKYGGSKKVCIYAVVQYVIELKTQYYWIVWPFKKGKKTTKTLRVKKINVGWS